MPTSYKRMLKKYKDAGWILKRKKGSHCNFEHPITKEKVTIPDHGSKDIPKGLEQKLLKQYESTSKKIKDKSKEKEKKKPSKTK